jgi:hypothetical protein
MRIVSVRPLPVARIVAIVYALIGLASFLVFEFDGAQTLTIPLGIVAQLFNLNLNTNLPRPATFFPQVLLGFGNIFAFALTGWLTGAFAALCFNLVAKYTGGIDAKYFSTIDEAKPMPVDGA